jgi:hypothetical protein
MLALACLSAGRKRLPLHRSPKYLKNTAAAGKMPDQLEWLNRVMSYFSVPQTDPLTLRKSNKDVFGISSSGL